MTMLSHDGCRPACRVVKFEVEMGYKRVFVLCAAVFRITLHLLLFNVFEGVGLSGVFCVS